jgi:KDO2-lipid IV(A) lauroyltransferase
VVDAKPPAPSPVIDGSRASPPLNPAATPATTERPRPRISDRFRREERREFRYVLSVTLAVICSWLVSVMPARPRYWLADRCGDFFWRVSPTYRANVLANLRQVLGPTTPPAAIELASRQVFRTSARNFADLLRLPRTSSKDLLRSIRIGQDEWRRLDEALAAGRGVVLLTAHLGAFDFAGYAISARGDKVTSVTGRTAARFIFDAVSYLRRAHGMQIVEASPSGVRRVILALRRGELAAFLADYDFFQNGLPVSFFGRETTLPPGPIRIARETGAAVVGVFARRLADGYALSLAAPFHVEKTASLDDDLARGMRRAVAMLERAIAATPDQWVILQRVWPDGSIDPVRVFPIGSPLEGELLRRVDAVLPEPRRGGGPASDPHPADPAAAPTDRTDPPR